MPLLKLIIESNTKGRKESHNKYLAKRSYKTFTEKCKFWKFSNADNNKGDLSNFENDRTNNSYI